MVIDNVQAMAKTTDAEFSRLLGMKFEWTKFITDVLAHRHAINTVGADYEDMITDIVSGLLISLTKGALHDRVQFCIQTARDEDHLMNKLKPVLTIAIDYRFRDFRQHKSYRHSGIQFPEKFDATGSTEDVGGGMDAENLKSMIRDELQERFILTGKRRCELALQILPDRMEGLSLREICEKHELSRGSVVSDALNEIYDAVRCVAQELQEGWMIRFAA
jgi:hypothetical protein